MRHLWQRRLVPFRQLLRTQSKLPAHAVHLAVDSGVESGKPFVVDHQRLDLGPGQFRILRVGLSVK